MRVTLLSVLFLISFNSLGQIDSIGRFYAYQHQITWRGEFTTYKMEVDEIKKFLILKLDNYQGLEIMDSLQSNILTGKLNRVVSQNGRFLSKDTEGSYSGDFTIEIKKTGYSVQLSALNYFVKTQLLTQSQRFSFETLFLRLNGRFVKSAKKNSQPIDTFFWNTFKL